jgi:hypothetical protein
MSVFIFLMLPSTDRPEDIVDAEYIARRTGLSKATVLSGGGGVKDIPRARRKPAGWFRGDVDDWLKRLYEAGRAQKMKQPRPRLVRRKPRPSK